MKFADRFNEARKTDPRSEKELTQLLGLSIRAYYNYANGITCPKVDDLVIFERVFNKPRGWFLGVKGNDEKEFNDLENLKINDLKNQIKQLEEENREEKHKNFILDELAQFQRVRIANLESTINYIKNKFLGKFENPLKAELAKVLDVVKSK